MNEYLYRCRHIMHPTADIALLTFDPVNEPLVHTAGQYVLLRLANDTLIPLSIANAPQANGVLEFHIRHNAAHALAQQCVTEITENKTVYLSGPLGTSTLTRAKPNKTLLFLAGGTGFAPLRALLQSALKALHAPIYLYWGIAHPEDAYDLALLESWRKDFPHFHYTLVLSSSDYPAWSGPRGLVHNYAAQNHPALDTVCVFACGPFGMVKAAQLLLQEQGLDPTQFIADC